LVLHAEVAVGVDGGQAGEIVDQEVGRLHGKECRTAPRALRLWPVPATSRLALAEGVVPPRRALACHACQKIAAITDPNSWYKQSSYEDPDPPRRTAHGYSH
jgi:hypothetical protein